MDTNFNTKTLRAWMAAEKIGLCAPLFLCASALKKLYRQKSVFICVNPRLKNFNVPILKRDKKGVVYIDDNMTPGLFVS